MDEKLKYYVDYMVVHGKRDDAVYWIDIYVCECLHALDGMEPWLMGMKGSNEPTQMLSEVMRPGTDSSKSIVHRMMSLARRASPEQTKLGTLLPALVEHMDVFFDELKRVFGWQRIADAKTAFHELAEYLPAAEILDHSLERYQKTVQEKIDAFLRSWTVLYELCLDEEGVRKAIPMQCAYDRQTQAAVTEIHEMMNAKRGKGRPHSVGIVTKVWMVEHWFYLVDHPSGCKNLDVRTRVRYLDFWETYEKALKEKGFGSFDAAARALKTALGNARDGQLGERALRLVKAHTKPI